MCAQSGIALTVSLVLFIGACFYAVIAVEISDTQAPRWIVRAFGYAAVVAFAILTVVVSTTLFWGCRW